MLAVTEHVRGVAPPPHLDLRCTLGERAWARLPSALRRRFAPGHGPASYTGNLDAERSAIGWLFALIAGPLGRPLPSRAGRAVPAEVRVRQDGPGVTWERWLLEPGRAAVRVCSTKLPGPDGTVLERTRGVLGLGLVMRLDVAEEGGGIVFRSRGYALVLGRLRLPLPGLLTPGCCTVEHRAEGPGRFRFTLTMDHPVWGRTFRQSGVFADPAPETADNSGKELPL